MELRRIFWSHSAGHLVLVSDFFKKEKENSHFAWSKKRRERNRILFNWWRLWKVVMHTPPLADVDHRSRLFQSVLPRLSLPDSEQTQSRFREYLTVTIECDPIKQWENDVCMFLSASGLVLVKRSWKKREVSGGISSFEPHPGVTCTPFYVKVLLEIR